MRLTELRSFLESDLYVELKHRNVSDISWQPEQNLFLLASLDMANITDSSLLDDLEDRFVQHYYLVQAVFNSYGHKFHILTPSPWPFFTSLSTLGLGLNSIYIMHADAGVFGLLFALSSFLFCLFLWWRDVLHEAVYEDKHTSVVRQGLRMGMRLFIISEVMFFFSFFWAYFHHALSPSIFIGGVWPPRGVLPVYIAPSYNFFDFNFSSSYDYFYQILHNHDVIDAVLSALSVGENIDWAFAEELRPFWDPYVIPLAMTIVLITSGITVTAAHTYVRLNEKQSAFIELFLTLVLAIVFLFLQIFEYVNSPFSINTSVFGSTFFMTTGFHGFHVLIGGIFLSVWTIRLFLSFDSDLYVHPDRHVGLECAIWYWHFVDVVWIFLFFSCYWWLVPEPSVLFFNTDFGIDNYLISSIDHTLQTKLETETDVQLIDSLDGLNVESLSDERTQAPLLPDEVSAQQPKAIGSAEEVISEKSFLFYFISTITLPANAGPSLDTQTIGELDASYFVVIFTFFLKMFFKFLFFFCNGVSQLTGGFIVPLIVFCPVILAMLASSTSTIIINKIALALSRRLEFLATRLCIFRLLILAAAPYRYSPLSAHWVLSYLNNVFNHYAVILNDFRTTPWKIFLAPFRTVWRFFFIHSRSFRKLKKKLLKFWIGSRAAWVDYGTSIVTNKLYCLYFNALGKCDKNTDKYAFGVNERQKRFYQPVNYTFYRNWFDYFNFLFSNHGFYDNYRLLHIILAPKLRTQPVLVALFFRLYYRVFLRTHRLLGPAKFAPRFSEEFYDKIDVYFYYLWRLIFIERELTNMKYLFLYYFDAPFHPFRFFCLPQVVSFIFSVCRFVVNLKLWYYARIFVRLFIRRHEFRSLWYQFLGKLRNLTPEELKQEYGPKLHICKRYPWEAWREQVWFVNLCNVLYLRAQQIAGFEGPYTPFARAVRNPCEPRFVSYLFPPEDQSRELKSPMQPYFLNNSIIEDPCLTQRYHRVDEYLCSGGAERYGEVVVLKREYDVFGFCLHSHNPYENYYYSDYVPSHLVYPPGSFGYDDCVDLQIPRSMYYYFEETQSKALHKSITTFHRWYQFSVMYLLFSIAFILSLLLLRLGLNISISATQFGLSSDLLSFTTALYTWFTAGSFTAFISWRLTEVTGTMLAVVAIVSTCVFIYAKDYMATDPQRRTFLVHLLFFTAFMNVFIVSDDFVTLFIGWEGVGLSSFFLINFWNTRLAATKAAIKAMLVNKVGDCALLAAIVFSHLYFGTTSFSILFDTAFWGSKGFSPIFGGVTVISGLVFLLFVAAMAKSAQFGLHSWLPDAMEGPTPVSALIHAATMVTAGVLLLIKFSPFIIASQLGGVIAFVGVLTAIFAGSVALVQHDIKKIIAYSTCSQLGLMVMACGLGFPLFAFFHLVTHAFFKALLFLSAGVIVHAADDEQDIRRMGGLQLRVPMAHASFLIGTFCITGFPFFSGFYSKELVVLSTQLYSGSVYVLCCLATMLTVLYSLRLYCYVMLGKFNGSSGKLTAWDNWINGRTSVPPIVESWNSMSTALLILSLISTVSGYVLKNFFEVYAVQFQSLGSSAGFSLQTEHLSVFSRWVPFILSCFAALVYLWSFFSPDSDLALTSLKTRLPLFYAGLVHKWFFDHLTNKLILRLLSSARTMYTLGDKGFIEMLLGAKVFFSTIFSSVRLFLSKYIFGVSFSEALIISIFFISLSVVLSFFILL